MKTVYLLGSGKSHGQSTSEALARYFHAHLLGVPGQSDDGQPFRAFEAKKLLHASGVPRVLDALQDADLLVLASPIYIDALPYPVVHALNVISAARQTWPDSCRFIALLNCGFPESAHCALALRMCALFARQAQLTWSGGLALGGGEAIHGQPLEQAGRRARNARRALEQAALALSKGEMIPDDAVTLMAAPVVPAFLYRLLGGWGWHNRARALGTTTPLDAKPFVH